MNLFLNTRLLIIFIYEDYKWRNLNKKVFIAANKMENFK